MTLKQQIDYLEKTENVTVLQCALYRRRHIFYADDGNYYVLLKAGVYQFLSLSAATHEIDYNPEKFPTT